METSNDNTTPFPKESRAPLFQHARVLLGSAYCLLLETIYEHDPSRIPERYRDKDGIHVLKVSLSPENIRDLLGFIDIVGESDSEEVLEALMVFHMALKILLERISKL